MISKKNRATTPEQKKKMLDRLLKVWLDCPHLRLGQLIIGKLAYSCGRLESDPFYVEDEEFIEIMEKKDE